MQRFFNPILTLTQRASNFLPRRTWHNFVNARPPLRQQKVLDKSVLRVVGKNNSALNVLSEKSLSKVDDKISVGRSKGYKVMRMLPDGTQDFYYFKLPHYRFAFVKELVMGALARELLGEMVPAVYAVEIAAKDKNGLSQFALASQSLSDPALHDINMENSALTSNAKNMGRCLAFKLLIGDSDIKAANLVPLMYDAGCTPIDHEYACDRPPYFITDASEALKQVKDFQPKAADSLFVPLQDKPDILKTIFPIWKEAIQEDISRGKIIKLYRKFSELSPYQLHGLFNQFGPLIKPEEQAAITQDLLARQHEALKFLVAHDASPSFKLS